MSNVKRIFISSALEKINDIQHLDILSDSELLESIEVLAISAEQAGKLATVIGERADDQISSEGAMFIADRMRAVRENIDSIYIDLAMRTLF